MTKKIFWKDPYLTRLDTEISMVNGERVSLKETIFYAFSGGQESDSGSIDGNSVLDAVKNGLNIDYTLPVGHGLQPGDQVTVTIDWPRRYRLMRLHFAAELILELVYQKLDGIEKIGAHIAEDKARLDFLWQEKISSYFPELLQQAQDLVREDRDIISAFSDEQQQRRYWEVPGFARVGCGGTHLKRTGEVGTLTLKRKNIGKGKERIEIYLAEPERS